MCIEFFSTECHTIKAKVIIMAKEETKIPLRVDDNWEWKHPNYLKRGKRRAAKLWLVLVLHLIGWESGASFFDRSQGEVKQNQSNPWLLSTLNWKLLSPWIIFRGGDVNETTEFLLFQINDKILLRYSWCEQKSNQLSRIAIESE